MENPELSHGNQSAEEEEQEQQQQQEKEAEETGGKTMSPRIHRAT